MKPQPKHQPLYFTPRTPWGTRLPGTSFFDHLKASENGGKQPVPPVQPVPPHPNFLQKFGSGITHGATSVAHGVVNGFKGLGHVISSGHPTGSFEVRKDPGAATDFSVNAGWGWGETRKENPQEQNKSFAAQNGQDISKYKDPNEEESTTQASPDHVTTEQEMAAAHQRWANENPEEIKRGADAMVAKYRKDNNLPRYQAQAKR